MIVRPPGDCQPREKVGVRRREAVVAPDLDAAPGLVHEITSALAGQLDDLQALRRARERIAPADLELGGERAAAPSPVEAGEHRIEGGLADALEDGAGDAVGFDDFDLETGHPVEELIDVVAADVSKDVGLAGPGEALERQVAGLRITNVEEQRRTPLAGIESAAEQAIRDVEALVVVDPDRRSLRLGACGERSGAGAVPGQRLHAPGRHGGVDAPLDVRVMGRVGDADEERVGRFERGFGRVALAIEQHDRRRVRDFAADRLGLGLRTRAARGRAMHDGDAPGHCAAVVGAPLGEAPQDDARAVGVAQGVGAGADEGEGALRAHRANS